MPERDQELQGRYLRIFFHLGLVTLGMNIFLEEKEGTGKSRRKLSRPTDQQLSLPDEQSSLGKIC